MGSAIRTLGQMVAGPKKTLEEIQHDLCRAVFDGNVPAIQRALNDGADIDALTTGQHALGVACYYSNLTLVRYLVEHKANVNAPDQNGESALITASKKGAIAIVSYLLEHHADVSQTTHLGWTALHAAIDYVNRIGPDYDAVALLLLQHKAQPVCPRVPDSVFDGQDLALIAKEQGLTRTSELLNLAPPPTAPPAPWPTSTSMPSSATTPPDKGDSKQQ